jgi:hypothetical protein
MNITKIPAGGSPRKNPKKNEFAVEPPVLTQVSGTPQGRLPWHYYALAQS